MSKLVALCFDADASPRIRFAPHAAADPDSRDGLFGWGVGWYPSSERGASVVKDPTSSSERSVDDALGDWDRFRSTLFVCHLRGHQRPRKQQDAQPFVRSYGGRQWIFAHDGDLARNVSERFPLPDDGAFEPLGRTDSEHAFCLILSRLHLQRVRSLSEIAPAELHRWLVELNLDGRLNALLTDGDDLAVYRDSNGRGGLYRTRRVPPHASTQFASDVIEIALDPARDVNRTALLFSSVPLDGQDWREVSPGELLIARRGSIVWSSHPEPAEAALPRGPRGITTVGQVETVQQIAAAQPFAVTPRPLGARPGEAQSRVLRVVHETIYAYAQPVEQSSHRLLLRPVEDRHQELIEFSMDVDPPVSRIEYDDVFGNAATALEISAPYQQLNITCRTLVRLRNLRTIEQRAAHGRHAIPLVWMPWQRQMLSAYLLPPELPETQLRELSAFAMGFVERNDSDLVGTLLDLNETLYRDFEYVTGSTTVETTAFEVFESRRGVCQDFANLMICLARLLHVPARYRMGYIFTGAEYENTIQSEASHAWVEVYLPQVGWLGLDPTNGIQVGANHVRVACGRNYRDATPTSGTIYRGGAIETLTIAVRVEEQPGD